MKFEDCRAYDALGLAELVRNGEITADELLDTALAAIEAIDPALNAFVGVYEAQARRAIGKGLPDGPFRGVPFSIKDLVTDVRRRRNFPDGPCQRRRRIDPHPIGVLRAFRPQAHSSADEPRP